MAVYIQVLYCCDRTSALPYKNLYAKVEINHLTTRAHEPRKQDKLRTLDLNLLWDASLKYIKEAANLWFESFPKSYIYLKMKPCNKRLYLHIGCHKTGTTSIQKTLFSNPVLLKQNNIAFFVDMYEKSRRNYLTMIQGNTWIDFEPDRNSVEQTFELLKTSKGGYVCEPQLLAEKLARLEQETVILSAEYFSWIFDVEELIKLERNLRRYFDEIKIIVYIRRQDRLTISHFNQSVKLPDLPAQCYYGFGTGALPTAKANYDEYLDFDARLGLWEQVFGIENIHVRVFEPESLIAGDAVVDFFNLLGIVEGFDSNWSNPSIWV